MSVGSRLKLIRKDLDLSQKKFSEKFSVHYRTIDNYEKDLREIPQSFMSKLFQMGYSISWLLTGDGSMRSSDYIPEDAVPFRSEGGIPVLGLTAAGPDGFFDEVNVPRIQEAEEFIPRPEGCKDPNAYALRISLLNGDSMMPFFRPSELIIASPMETVINNDKAIVKLKDGRVLFKVIRFKEDHIELISANTAYKTIIVPSSDLVFAHKVIGSWGK
jgi:phage repressor protein C with HTH and peptisase S24 domain